MKKFRNYKVIANLSLIFIFTIHFILLSRFAGVLKELQPSGHRKISRPVLGILQKNKLGSFSQRKNSWAGHMVNIKYKPGLDGPQPSSNPAPSQQ